MRKPNIENISFGKLITKMKKFEINKLKNGYYGDASEWAYMKYVLLLLKDISNKLESNKLELKVKYRKRQKRKPTKFNLFMKKGLLKGKTMQEVAKEWKVAKRRY